MSRVRGRGRRGQGDSHGSHGSGERWLVSYADLITLLFALFVVMYASSQADVKKLKAVAEGVRKAFGDSGGTATTAPRETGASVTIRDELHPFADLQQQFRAAVTGPLAAPEGGAGNGNGAMGDADVPVPESKSLALELPVGIVFAGESAVFSPSATETLDRVGKVLATHPGAEGARIVVESSGAAWGLATERGVALIRAWESRRSVAVGRFELVARGGTTSKSRVRIRIVQPAE